MSETNSVERSVRPCAWLREQRDWYEGSATLAPLLILGDSDVRPHSASQGATYEPLYAQSALDAAVAAERERFIDALAFACIAAEIPDSKYESLLIALRA